MTISQNKKKAVFAVAALALSVPIVEARGCGGWGSSCGGMFPRPRRYLYHRRPSSSMFDLMSEIRSIPIYFNSLHRQSEADRSAPRYEMHEGPDGGVELTLEVPGVEAKDLSVELEEGNVLRIRGSRRLVQRGSTMESKFDQMFRMDDHVDVEKLSVTLSSGLLRISAPRKERTVRKIPIESMEVEEIVEAKALPENKANGKETDVADVKLAKDLNAAQTESQNVVDGLTITEDEE